MIRKYKCSIGKILFSVFTLIFGLSLIFLELKGYLDKYFFLFHAFALIIISIINTIYMNELIHLNEHHIVIVHKLFWWRKKILIDLREIEKIIITTSFFNSRGKPDHFNYTFIKMNGKQLKVKFGLKKQDNAELQQLFTKKGIHLNYF